MLNQAELITSNKKEIQNMKKNTVNLVPTRSSYKKATMISYIKRNSWIAVYMSICVLGCINPAYADWFKVGDIKNNLITPIYTLVNDNLGFVAFAVGGASTFLVRGQDMYQKAIAFGIGSLGTAGAVKLAQTVLHLG